ncbi:mitochondrial 54S ribosomal protein uL13m [Lipomyces oligophaga]|uniref:mitochondrial 54S ribosomal protein uL13m n=1 Tax=Lipomyces oligophaga TaxID=45792 RepID=UPI0034CE8AE7
MSNITGKTRLAYSRVWHHVDLRKEERTLGRLASAIAITLMGKHKPIFHPGNDCGDYVVVTNCNLLKTSGDKFEQKLYRKHTMRPGGLKEMNMQRLAAKQGMGEALRKAVSGMLPKNHLRGLRLSRLKTAEGNESPHLVNTIKFWTESPELIETSKVFRKSQKSE